MARSIVSVEIVTDIGDDGLPVYDLVVNNHGEVTTYRFESEDEAEEYGAKILAAARS